MRVTLLATLVMTPVLRAQVPAGTVSAPISDIRYEVTVDSAATGNRHLGVAMTFTSGGEGPVVLSLPAWSPGHYVLLWFARRVSNLSVEGDGQPLDWHKLDFQTWRLEPHAGQIRVSFDYLADTIDRAVAWTRPDFAFFNGTNVFLYPVGRPFDWPATVTVRTSAGWRVTTGMAPGAEPGTFTAANYHDLTDMPFFVGRFDLDSAKIADRWIRLAWYPAGTLTAARAERTFGWLRGIVPAEVAVFGDAPFRNYTIFQISDTVVNGGGLEHQSSQMDEVTSNALDSPGLPGLYAHEFFHAWNVKRLRPADLVPYRYDEAQQTRWLWVSEGVTSYYGSLAQVRGGIKDSAGFFADIANASAGVMATPPVALGDASLDAWIGATDGTGGIYYAKGEVAGFLLDVLIRDASDNRHSLDDVMKELYDTTWRAGRGFTAEDWWSAVERAGGAGDNRFREFARRYVDGREPFPFSTVLPLAGLQLVAGVAQDPRTGMSRQVIRVVPDPAASAKAARIRHGIVTGTVQ